MVSEKEFMDTIHYGEIEEIHDEYLIEHIKHLSSTLEYFDALYKDNGLIELKTVNSRIRNTIKAMTELSEKMENHLINNAQDVELTIKFKHQSDNANDTRDFIARMIKELQPLTQEIKEKHITVTINGQTPPRNNWGQYGWENL